MRILKSTMWRKVVKIYSKHPDLFTLILLIILSLPQRLLFLTEYPSIIIDEYAYLRDIEKIYLSGNYYFALPQWDASQAYLVYYPTLFFTWLNMDPLYALRLQSAITSLLGLIPFFFITKRFTNRFIAFNATVLYASSYYYLQFSRVGWGVIFALTFGLFTLWVFLLTLEKKSLWMGIVSSVFASITFYSYRAGIIYILTPIIILFVNLILGKLDRIFLLKIVLIYVVTLILLSIPWILHILNPTSEYFLRGESVSINNTLLPYLKMYNKSDIFLYQIKTAIFSWIFMVPIEGTGGHIENPRYLPLSYPAISPLLISLFLFGMLLAVARFKETSFLFFIFFTILISSQIFTVYPPNGARALGLLPIIYVFIALSLNFIYKSLPFHNNKKWVILMFTVSVCITDILFYIYWMTWIKVF